MILYFSGTGNSRAVARYLATLSGDRIVGIGRKFIEQPELSATGGRVIWVFPCYSWGVPPVVRRVIANVKGDKGDIHHAVVTFGDDVGLTAEMFRSDIISRGMKPGGVWGVRMPNTYVLLPGFDVDTGAVADAKLAAADSRIEAVWAEIKKGVVSTDIVRGTFPGIKTKVIYPLFTRYMMSPKPFAATDACVGCGKCADSCPMDNIKMKQRRPEWGTDCSLCLGCYHVCPHHAVTYGRVTRRKGQYRHP